MSPRDLEVDSALTAGYARAHALEGEWLRIERALAVANGDAAALIGRQRVIEARLVELRESLAELRSAVAQAERAYEAAEPARL